MASTADDMDTLVAVRDVSFSYGQTPVLYHITFNIRTGDFLAVIGPNGSGKTTLVKIILGLLEPSRGLSWLVFL